MEPPIDSPDAQESVQFLMAGEVQMGAPYFHAHWNGRPLGDRFFGDKCTWSNDGRYFGLQEWLSLDRSQGPETQVLVVDTKNHRECVLARAKGFIIPVEFREQGVMCSAVRYPGKPEEHFVPFPPEREWKAVDLSPPARPWAERHPVAWPPVAFLLWALPWVTVGLLVLALVALIVWAAMAFVK